MHTHTHTHAHIRTPVLISFVVIYSATTHLPQLWLAYVLNIIDRTNLAYAQLQMKTDLGLSARDFGYASGIFFVAYAMMQVPANHAVADPRVGATRVLALSMIAWGISATATSRVNSPAQLYSLRFCLGMSESPFFPGVLFYLTRWFPDATSGRATAFFVSAASVGGLLSSAGSGLLLSALDGVLGIRGWRWLLAVEGLPTILLGVIAPCFLDEHPRTATWLSNDERAVLVDALENDRRRQRRQAPAATSAASELSSKGRQAADTHTAYGDDDAELTDAVGTRSVGSSESSLMRELPPPADSLPRRAPLARTLRATVATTPCLIFCAQYAVSAAIANSARFFLPTLLKDIFPELPPWKLGLVFAIPAAFKIVLSPPLAAWSDRGGQPRRFKTATGLYASAAGLLVVAGVGIIGVRGGRARPAFCIALFCVADVLCQLAIPIFWSLHHAMQPSALKGCSIAVVNSVGNGVGGFFGPWFLGAAHDAVAVAGVCAVNKTACVSQWGWGVAALGGAMLSATVACRTLLLRRWV